MTASLRDMLRVLDLEKIEENLFRGESRDIGSRSVFGGQVLGQALVAASRTVSGRNAHSLHAYFLRPGDMNTRASRSIAARTSPGMSASASLAPNAQQDPVTRRLFAQRDRVLGVVHGFMVDLHNDVAWPEAGFG